eukprot:PRCOL_00001909-RA
MGDARATLAALRAGYRGIDTAFVYGGEKTEREVGAALRAALDEGVLRSREDVCVTTKQWRKYHGYAETLKCLDTSLRRLDLEWVDLYLMHWPGPAYSTMNRRKDMIERHGAWYYAKEGHSAASMPALRAETWRAMEDAKRAGKCRAIGVSNCTVAHLEALKRTAREWPPAVNQVEMHPYYAQAELLEYCAREGIVLQAYASLGGQDASRAKMDSLGGDLLECDPAAAIAAKHAVTTAQVLLRWGLQRGAAVIPKTVSDERLAENAGALGERRATAS